MRTPRILAVDDDPVILGFVEAYLAADGFEVVTCPTALDGLNKQPLAEQLVSVVRNMLRRDREE